MHIQYEKTVEIDRPIEDVFEYLTTPANDPAWIPSVSDVSSPETDMAEGTTWRREIDMFGGTEIVVECTEFERPTRFSYRSQSGMFGGRVRNAAVATLTSEGDRTHLSFAPTIAVSGFMQVFRPLLARMARSETATSLEQLQSALESRTKQPA